MSSINVMFDVPELIQRGLSDGTMRLFGGTVRNLKGEIVAHLASGKWWREALQSGAPFDSSALTSAVGHAQSAALLASGIGAINLAVNAASFAMIRHKLNTIMDQLGQTLTALDDLTESVNAIRSMQQSKLRADIDTACDLASRATRVDDKHLFREARTGAYSARRQMVHRLRELLKSKRIITRRNEFVELVVACVELARVEASCNIPIEGSEQAAVHLSRTAQELAELGAQFEIQCRDFSVDTAARINLGPRGISELQGVVGNLRESTESLYFVAGQLTICGNLGVSQDEWREMTEPKDSRWVTCVIPSDTAEPALLTTTLSD